MSEKYGDCQPPKTAAKEIRISAQVRGELLLDTLVHELLHAAGWNLSEEFVAEFASDVARVLWRLGLRFADPGKR